MIDVVARNVGRPLTGGPLTSWLREQVVRRLSGPGDSTTPVPACSRQERALAMARLAVAVVLAPVLALHPAAHGVPAVLALVALGLSSAAMLHPRIAVRLPHRMLNPHTLFGIETDAALALALAYPAPDVLSWLPFCALIVSGAVRWTVNGATLAYTLYLVADLLATLHVPGGPFGGPNGVRIGVIGLTATVVGVLARCALQFRSLQARTAELDAAMKAHRETAVRLRSLLDNVGDGIVTFDESGRIESANHGAAVLFGRTAEDLTGTTVDMLVAPKRRRSLAARLERGAMEWETEGLRGDGTSFSMDFRSSEMRLGNTRLFIATLRDTSELKARTEALQHQALHDNLTGLPNRLLLADRLGQAINRAVRAGRPAALLIMDMDGFKEVNDTLGHHSGDALLRQVAERLRGTLRTEDTVARLGGDEFAVLPAGACNEAAAMRVAATVLSALQAPFYIDEQAIHARMSIGVAVYPTHGVDGDTLMRRADVAMYTAKRMRSGRASYSPKQDEHSKRRLQLTGELRRAIPASELVLHYQPRLHLPTKTITALEALVRWQHPVQGLVPPAEFIPVAEQSDLIHPLTAWVAGEAVRQLRAFQERGLDLDIAINVSARNLADQQLPALMANLLAQWGVGASKLRLEMTESVVMASDWQEVLTQLHQLGLSVAIDDFGVGYSSLAYLQRLPVDEIKIDRSFVTDMVDNPDNAAIVRSTIELGHNLGLKVVAEGVENEDCLRMLTAFGCDSAQGFLVSPPLATEELVEFLAARDAAVLPLRRSA